MTKRYIKNCTGDQCKEERDIPRILSKIIFYILSIFFVGVLCYTLFFSQYLKLSHISIDGTRELDKNELGVVIDNSLQGKFLNIIPKNNFMFASQGRMEKLLMNSFKKIRSVRVNKKFPDTVDIVIDERKALLVWCSGDKCYLLDEKGVAYSEADFSSADLVQNNLLQIDDVSGREVKIDEQIINPSYEKYVLNIKDVLNGVGFNITGKYLTPSRMAEEITVKTDQDLEVYLSTQYDLESAIRTLNTILKKEILPEKIKDLAYIDLRDENKVFYKFKNVEPIITDVQQDINTNIEIK